MKLTSMDINNKEFKRAIRGYNSDEVDEFLEKISEDYEMLYKENSSLKEKASNLNEKLQHYLKIENTIQNTLLLAQNSAEQARQAAKKEAENIIKNANLSSQEIIDKANKNVSDIEEEYEKTKQEFLKFKIKFKNFMTTQMDMFNSIEKDFASEYGLGDAIKDEISEKDIEKDIEKEDKSIENAQNHEAESQNDDKETIAPEDIANIKNFYADEKQ